MMDSPNYLSKQLKPRLLVPSSLSGSGFFNENTFMMEKEIWKPIPNTDNRYEISNYGRARSWCNCNEGRRKEPRILKQGSTPHTGYKMIAIWNNGKHKTVNIHRAVAKLFIPNPENKRCVNHIDCDKENNHVNNLEWVTHAENTRHAIKNGIADVSGLGDRRGEAHGMAKLTKEAVIDIRKQAKERGRYYGQEELSERHGVCKGTIKDVVAGRTWTHVKIK